MFFIKNITITFLILISTQCYQAQNIDIALLRSINENRNAALDNSLRISTQSVAPLSIATPLLLFGAGLIQKDTVIKQQAIYIGASIFTAGTITTILKYTVNRERPFSKYTFIEKVTHAGIYSFPSGHTTNAFALATSLSLTYKKWYVIAPAYLWCLTASYSRMHLGVHYPSDVLAGALIGSGSAYLCYVARKWLNAKTKFIQ